MKPMQTTAIPPLDVITRAKSRLQYLLHEQAIVQVDALEATYPTLEQKFVRLQDEARSLGLAIAIKQIFNN